MDHLRFKSEQTAATYVADGLDPETREQFELHLMSCPECVEEVEGWRAIKSCLPRDAQNGTCREAGKSCDRSAGSARNAETQPRATAQAAEPSATPGAPGAPAPKSVVTGRSPPSSPGAPLPPPVTINGGVRWRVAAALAAGVLVGAAGGWYGRSVQGPALTGGNIAFYSLPPLMRGPADCTSVRIGPRVDLIALRVPAAAKEQQLVAVDSEGHDLAPEEYSVRMQTDGSWLVRLRAPTIREQGIRFEARSADGTVEPRGCVVSGTQD